MEESRANVSLRGMYPFPGQWHHLKSVCLMVGGGGGHYVMVVKLRSKMRSSTARIGVVLTELKETTNNISEMTSVVHPSKSQTVFILAAESAAKLPKYRDKYNLCWHCSHTAQS